MLENIMNLKGIQILKKDEQLKLNGGYGGDPFPSCIQQGRKCCFNINGALWCDFGRCVGPGQCAFN